MPTTNHDPLDRVKEVKVKIPLRHHVRLHSMKVLTGKQISDAVVEALEAYFHEPVGPVPPSHVVREQLADVTSE